MRAPSAQGEARGAAKAWRLTALGVGAGIAALIVLALLAGDGESPGEEMQTFEGEGFTLELPASWNAPNVAFPVARAAEEDLDDSVLGLDDENWIVAYSFDRAGSTSISERNVMAFAPALRDTYLEISAAAPNGKLIEPPYAVEVGGLPGLRLRSSYLGTSGEMNTLQLAQLFGSERGYVVGCNFTEDDEEVVVDACERALETLEESG